MQPKTEAVTDYVELTGNAAPVLTVKLIARVEGYLDAQHFHDGAIVKKGDLLFTIQQDQYKAQLQQAQSQVLAAKAKLVYARTEVARYRELVKKDAAAQVEVDHWVYERQAAEAKLLGAEAQVAIAKLNLGYTEVRAPFDGQMGKALIDPGNVVGGAGPAGGARRNRPARPDLRGRQSQPAGRPEDPGQSRSEALSLAELLKVPVEVGLQDESGFPASRHARIRLAGDRSGDRNDAGARRAARTRTATCCRVFRPHAPADGATVRATRCWCRTGRCRKTRAAAICLSSTATTSSRSAMSSSAKLFGGLRAITSGLSRR